MATLEGRVALVTGASRGFGRAVALALGRAGAEVVVDYNASVAAAEEVVAELRRLGRRAEALRADVAREDEVRTLVDGVLARFERLDILVNNAGVMVHGGFLDIPPKEYDEMMAVNVRGTILCTFYALPAMIRRRWGRIVNLSSQLATLGAIPGGARFAAYAATKGAIESFTKAIAKEFGHQGITVNAIAPGSIETDMSRAVMTPEFKARRITELPVGRLGTVDDVAHAVVFLASDTASFLTGQVLHVSGGLVMP